MNNKDSNYTAVARYARRPLSKTYHQVALSSDIHNKNISGNGVIDDDQAWVADILNDDEVEIARHEAAVAPLLEEGELDADAIVVSPTGNSASAANNGMCLGRTMLMLFTAFCV